MTSSWNALVLAALAAGAPAPSGDEPLPEGALVRLGSWTLRHRDPVSAVAFGAGGVISVGVDGRANVWSSEDGARLASLAEAGPAILDVAWTSDDRALLVRADGSMTAWTPGSDPSEPIGGDLGLRIALAPSGAEACFTGRDAIARLVALETAEVRAEIDLVELNARAAAFAPDGDLLAVVGMNRNRLLRRAGTEDQVAGAIVLARASDAVVERRIDSKERILHTVAFTPEGDRVVATDDQGGLHVWSVADGAPVAAYPCDPPVSAGALVITPSGDAAVVGRDDGTIEVIALADGASRAVAADLRVPVTALAISDDGRRLAAAVGVEVRLFDLPELAPRASVDRHRGPISAIAWSADGARVVTGSYDQDARIWDAETGAAKFAQRGNAGFVYAVALDAGHLLVSGQDGHVRVVDPSDGAVARDLAAHDGACTDFAVSPDGKSLATAGADGVLRIADRETGEARHVVSGLPGIQFQVAWSPDGARDAVGSTDVRLVDAATGEVLQTFPRLPAPLTGLEFAPDGATLAGGLADRTIVLLEQGDAPRRFLHGHSGRLSALDWSPDGKLLASASANETGVRLWSMPEGAPAGTLEGFEREVLALAFDPAGERIAAGSLDGIGLIWAVPGAKEER